MQEPRVEINNGLWHRKNGLRITTVTGHGDGNNMYSVQHARILARELSEACDKIMDGDSNPKGIFIDIGKKLGFIDS